MRKREKEERAERKMWTWGIKGLLMSKDMAVGRLGMGMGNYGETKVKWMLGKLGNGYGSWRILGIRD